MLRLWRHWPYSDVFDCSCARADDSVVLAAWLENTHHHSDSVVSYVPVPRLGHDRLADETTDNLPASTLGAISGARPRGANYDMQKVAVQAIVLALERRNSKARTLRAYIFPRRDHVVSNLVWRLSFGPFSEKKPQLAPWPAFNLL